MAEGLDGVVERLQRAAAELRGGELDHARAAALVEECARLAADGAALLDRELRAGEAQGLAPGQMAFE